MNRFYEYKVLWCLAWFSASQRFNLYSLVRTRNKKRGSNLCISMKQSKQVIWQAKQSEICFKYSLIAFLSRWQTAKYLPKQRYGFVFGVNMFGALLVETILTAIVVDKNGLGVGIRTQVGVRPLAVHVQLYAYNVDLSVYSNIKKNEVWLTSTS